MSRMTRLGTMLPAFTATVLLAPLAVAAPATATTARPDVARAAAATSPSPPAPQVVARRRAPSTPNYTGSVVVRYAQARPTAPGSTSSQRALAATGRRTGKSLRNVRTLADGSVVVDGATPRTARSVAADLAKQPGVLTAEPEVVGYPLAGADPLLPYQWNLADSRIGVRATTAWARGTGAGTRVAVLDTGITPHPDLAGQTVGGYDFITDKDEAKDGTGRDPDPADPGDWAAPGECSADQGPNEPPPPPDPGHESSWHGSLVAGVIAAVKGNAQGISGIAPGTKVVPVRVLGRCGGTSTDIADALRWAAGDSVPNVPANPYPAKVLNLSLGGVGTCPAVIQSAINTARGRGATVVVAAGNETRDVSGVWPAGCSGVVTVGATDTSGARAWYSNYGAGLTLVAPGGTAGASRGILSTANDSERDLGPDFWYYWTEGTSLAAPHVSAIAALVLGRTPSLTPDQVRATLVATARKSCSGCGAGLVDAARAIGLPAPTLPVISRVTPAAGPLTGGNVVTISGVGLAPTSRVTVGGFVVRVVRSSSTAVSVLVPSRRTPSTAVVSVTTPHGTSPTVTRSLYRYVAAPTVTRLSRRSGTRRGGTVLTVSGANLSGATAVYVGTQRARVLRSIGSRALVVRTPRVRRSGTVYIRVQTAGGLTSRSRVARFSYR